MILITWGASPPYDFTNTHDYFLPFIGIWAWYKFLFTAYLIEVGDDNSITFKSILKTKVFLPSDVLWVRESIGFLTIKLSDRKFFASIMISHVLDFKRYLLSANENIEEKKDGFPYFRMRGR